MKIVRWAIRVGQWQPSEAEWTRAAALIQPEEKERIGKFFFKKDAKSSMVGRLLIRKFLSEASGLRNSEIHVDRDDRGKPVFLDDPTILFNVSHQGDLAVLAGVTGCLPGHLLGVDVMKFEYSGGKTLSEFFRIMTRNFSQLEWSLIKKSSNEDDQLKEFCRHWSLKESYVKATGTGITVNLQDISFQTLKTLSGSVITDTKLLKKGDLLTNWTFEESVLENNEHCVSLARNFNCVHESFHFLEIADVFSSNLDLITALDYDYTKTFLLKDERP